MIKLKDLIKENDNRELVGFHRQRRPRDINYDDKFITGNEYGKGHFREILHSLHNIDRDFALRKRWTEFDWNNTYSPKYDKMESLVADWLNKKGYRWIFVTENRPIGVSAYGDYIYKMYFDRKDILQIFDDPYGADDIAYAYLYHVKAPPTWEEYDPNATVKKEDDYD